MIVNYLEGIQIFDEFLVDQSMRGENLLIFIVTVKI